MRGVGAGEVAERAAAHARGVRGRGTHCACAAAAKCVGSALHSAHSARTRRRRVGLGRTRAAGLAAARGRIIGDARLAAEVTSCWALARGADTRDTRGTIGGKPATRQTLRGRRLAEVARSTATSDAAIRGERFARASITNLAGVARGSAAAAVRDAALEISAGASAIDERAGAARRAATSSASSSSACPSVRAPSSSSAPAAAHRRRNAETALAREARRTCHALRALCSALSGGRRLDARLLISAAPSAVLGAAGLDWLLTSKERDGDDEETEEPHGSHVPPLSARESTPLRTYVREGIFCVAVSDPEIETAAITKETSAVTDPIANAMLRSK